MYNVYKIIKDLPKEKKGFLLSFGNMWKNLDKWAEKSMPQGLKWQTSGPKFSFDDLVNGGQAPAPQPVEV